MFLGIDRCNWHTSIQQCITTFGCGSAQLQMYIPLFCPIIFLSLHAIFDAIDIYMPILACYYVHCWINSQQIGVVWEKRTYII